MKTKPIVSKDFTIDNIHKIREWHYEQRKEMGVEEWLFVVSSGFENMLNWSGQEVDDADEGLIVSISSGSAFRGLKDAVERFDPGVAVT